MGDLSANFDREEFACKCCGQDTVDYKLIEILEYIREHFDAPVYITSGNRCATYNNSIGGARNSQHVLGRAADVVVDGVPPSFVAQLADDLGAGGVGSYEDFTHIDTREGRARWEG